MVFQPQNWHQCTSKNNGFELELSILGVPNAGLWATVFNIFQYHSDPQNVEKSFICPSQLWGLGMGFILTPLRPPPLWVGRWSHRHLEPRFECHLPGVSRRRCWNSLNLHNSKLFEKCLGIKKKHVRRPHLTTHSILEVTWRRQGCIDGRRTLVRSTAWPSLCSAAVHRWALCR